MNEPSQKKPDRKEKPSGNSEPALSQIHWDDSRMASTYANVVNANSSREEVTLFFGIHGSWNPAESKNFVVNLSNRVILNPRVAKRLLTLLSAVIAEYERRFGAISINPREDRVPESSDP